MDRDVPDGEEISNAANGIPSPFLSSVRMANSSKETREDHNDIRHHSHDGMCSINTSQQTKLENQDGGRDGPVHKASPVDLAAHIVERIRNVLVVISNADAVKGGRMPGGHGKVCERGDDGGQGGEEVEDATLDGHVPRQEGEDGGSHHHHEEENP